LRDQIPASARAATHSVGIDAVLESLAFDLRSTNLMGLTPLRSLADALRLEPPYAALPLRGDGWQGRFVPGFFAALRGRRPA
jgi:hypothetical protein